MRSLINHVKRINQIPVILLRQCKTASPSSIRYFSSAVADSQSEDAYLETWQRKQVKPASFYEEQAKRRHWFYTVDLQGRLFLEESPIKNIVTCLKDNKFLNFFFRQVRQNDTGFHPEYPYISPCGKEMNYILPADMPIVFHDLLDQHEEGGEDSKKELVYGGFLKQPFDPSQVYISHRTGRLYHAIDPPLSGWKIRGGPSFGLLRSHVGLLLSDHIRHDDNDESIMTLEMDNDKPPYVIHLLPEEAEPLYGLPPADDD